MGSGDVLVTGGAGFIGSNVVRAFVDDFDRVTVLDSLTYAGDRRNLEDLSADITFVEGSVLDRPTVDQLYGDADYVVNLAAQTHVDRSISDGLPFVESNVHGAYVAMDVLRDHDVERFVHVSTDEVYGSIRSGAVSEAAGLDPSSPYAASKASADTFVNAFWETYDLPITVLRPTNVYGPRQHPEKLVPKFVLRALDGQELPVYGDGENVRHWLYVDDFCSALRRVVHEGDDEIYNVAGDAELTNLEVTHRILEVTGASSDLVEFVGDRDGHDYRYALDDSKLRRTVDWEPSTTFESGLEETVDWYRSHRHRYST